jgi:hypothetical protein
MHELNVDLNPQGTRHGIFMIEYEYISFADNIDYIYTFILA